MPDTSGPSSLTPLAFYDPDSSCWRTSQATFPWEPPPCLETLPASGMTLAGVLYGLPTSEPATDAPDCSSLPTPRATRGGSATETVELLGPYLPTPTVADDMGTTYRNPRASANFETHHAVTLAQVAYKRFLPTPEASDGTGGRRSAELGGQRPSGAKRSISLATALHHGSLLPTPTTEPATGNGHARNLGSEARMLPTPTRRDHKGHNQRHDETCLTGALTAPPSPDTPPPSDDPPLILWTPEDG